MGTKTAIYLARIRAKMRDIEAKLTVIENMNEDDALLDEIKTAMELVVEIQLDSTNINDVSTAIWLQMHSTIKTEEGIKHEPVQPGF